MLPWGYLSIWGFYPFIIIDDAVITIVFKKPCMRTFMPIYTVRVLVVREFSGLGVHNFEEL